ncbi:MAG: imidazole glycerol phosphate synthase subunit HisH [Candidatus Methanoperedens sp.]|nr:imidazole glycerol phosphate synthase subunit HisH [Candidatus Methanoperedens sp.]
MIAIVNYGLGNIQALVNIYRRLNIPVAIADRADELRGADKIILPGVGAFDWAMTLLNESGMRKAIDEFVIEKRKPVLGICVGMQMMAQRSDEGILDGLGWIDAEVRRFDQSFFKEKMQLPHMGWNDVVPKKVDGLFRELENGARFYFLHSYYVLPSNPEWVLAVTNYGAPFASSVCAVNVYGVQFHPEKSHQWGIQLLKNFAEL